MNRLNHRPRFVTGRAPLTACAIFVALALTTTAATSASATGASVNTRLQAAASSSNGQTINALLAHFATDPALTALLAEANQASGLSSTQKGLLSALQLELQSPQLLQAVITHSALTPQQQQALQVLRAKLYGNPTILEYIQAAALLRSSQSNLAAQVARVTASMTMPVSSPPASGDAALDAVLNDFTQLRGSSAFTAQAATLTSIMSDPAFVMFLQQQPLPVITAFIPPGQVTVTGHAGVLPASLIGDLFGDVADFLGATALLIGGILLLPEELTGLVLVGAILVIAGGLEVVLHFEFNVIRDIFKLLDCDNDGDPGDPGESGEC